MPWRYLPLFMLLTATCQTYQAPSTGEPPLYQGQTLPLEAPLTRLALGSCNNEELPQDYWPVIATHQPNLWIWLGDNIYADTRSMASMEAQYRRQKFDPHYTAFRTTVPVVGTWDDHDYGANDGDRTYPRRRESRELLFDFLDVAPTDPARLREGAYQSYAFGPPGRRVRIILLDARYFRDKLRPNRQGPERYHPNPTGDLLGEAQWSWLEAELRRADAQLYLIGSGVQCIPQEQVFEKWDNFPAARRRLFELLQSVQPARTLLLSGDRHLAELSRIELPGLPYPLYELTASGLTHSYEAANEPNRYRVGPLVAVRHFGLLALQWGQPHQPPAVRVQVRGLDNAVLLDHLIP